MSNYDGYRGSICEAISAFIGIEIPAYGVIIKTEETEPIRMDGRKGIIRATGKVIDTDTQFIINKLTNAKCNPLYAKFINTQDSSEISIFAIPFGKIVYELNEIRFADLFLQISIIRPIQDQTISGIADTDDPNRLYIQYENSINLRKSQLLSRSAIIIGE